MPRFSSLIHAPAETRRLFRERLGRFLNAERSPQAPDEREKLDDELFLELMLGLDVQFDADVNAAHAIFDAADRAIRCRRRRVLQRRLSSLPKRLACLGLRLRTRNCDIA
jgi:hypothetical protein